MALPTIIPSTFFKFFAFLMSSIDETPPDIITGQFDISATLMVSLKFGPTEYFWFAILGLTLIST